MSASAAAPLLPTVFLADPHALAAERLLYQTGDPHTTAAVAPLVARANRDLAVTPVSVMTKQQLPPNGDRHEYLSQSVYAWPDPSKPNGLPYVIRDGQRNPAVNSIPDKAGLNDVIDWSQELAYAYYFTGDPAYAAKATTILATWFLTPATRMNPDLTYAQGVPGSSSGQPGGIIDAADLPKVVDAVGLLAGSPAWTTADQQGMKGWFISYLAWLKNSSDGRAEAVTTNNHATWYADQVISYALFVGNPTLARSTVQQAESSDHRRPDQVVAAPNRPSWREPTPGPTAPTTSTRWPGWRSWPNPSRSICGPTSRRTGPASARRWTMWPPTRAAGRVAVSAVGDAVTLQYLAQPLYAAAAAYRSATYANEGGRAPRRRCRRRTRRCRCLLTRADRP